LGARQDEQSAYDGDNHGVFTQALLKVCGRGDFDKGYREFHRQILHEINLPQQRPNLLELPPVDQSFAIQRPFTIWGRTDAAAGGQARPGASAKVDRAPAAPALASRRPIADLLVGEGDENDKAVTVTGAAAARGVMEDDVRGRFATYMRPLGLRYFAPEGFLTLGGAHISPGSSGYGLNSYPNEDLWPNIVETARLLDELRGSLGAPIRITSAYRNDAYNRAVFGVSDSIHKRFNACDFQAEGGGGIFQLGAAAQEGPQTVTLALGAVLFANRDRKKRIAFITWGAEGNDLWVAAERMSLNLSFYENVARPIVEAQMNDAERLIAVFFVAAPVN
jgi:hypothetical protein